MKQVYIAQARHLQPLCGHAVWDQRDEHLEYSGEVGVIDRLGPDKRVMLLDPTTDDSEVLSDAVFDVSHEWVLSQRVEHTLGLGSQRS